MDEKLQEDWLDARLREETPYFDDNGFTARVLQQLPRQRQRRSFRAIILLAATLFASVIAYQMSEGGFFIADAVMRMATMPILMIFILAALCGILITGLGLAAAVAKMRQERL